MNKREPLRYSDDEEKVPENPVRDRLEKMHEDLATEANGKQARAEELEHEAALLRAEVRGLRVAAEGVSRAIGEMREAYDQSANRQVVDDDYTRPGRFVGPEKVRRSDNALVADDGYNARAHANRYP